MCESCFQYSSFCGRGLETRLSVALEFVFCRDAFGESSIAGDLRWAGSYGVNIDFVARSHCAVEIIQVEDIQASA